MSISSEPTMGGESPPEVRRVPGPDEIRLLSTRDEYKAPRDEILPVVNRVVVVLTAEVAAFTTLVYKSLETTDGQRSLLLIAALEAVVAVGIALTVALYSHLYLLGSYIAIFFEHDAPGWHLRSRIMRIKLADLPLDGEPPASYERANEPATIARVYKAMAFTAPTVAVIKALLYFRFSLKPAEIGWVASGAFAVVAFLAGFQLRLLSHLRVIYANGSRRWLKRWRAYSQQGGFGQSATLIKQLVDGPVLGTAMPRAAHGGGLPDPDSRAIFPDRPAARGPDGRFR